MRGPSASAARPRTPISEPSPLGVSQVAPRSRVTRTKPPSVVVTRTSGSPRILARQRDHLVHAAVEVVAVRRPAGAVQVPAPEPAEGGAGVERGAVGPERRAVHAPGQVGAANLAPQLRLRRCAGQEIAAPLLGQAVGALDRPPIDARPGAVHALYPVLARLLVARLGALVEQVLGRLRSARDRRDLDRDRAGDQREDQREEGVLHSPRIAPGPESGAATGAAGYPRPRPSSSRISRTSSSRHSQGVPRMSPREGVVLPPSPLIASLT